MEKSSEDVENIPFEETSLLCLSLTNPLRRAVIRLVRWKWFERFSLFMIMANCIALCLVDPCDINCKQPLCSTMSLCEDFISIFFALEMLVKMTAMGVFGKLGYFSEGWNRFDCFIVVIGMFEFIFSDSEINFSAIRAIRVLRPLRAINRIQSLRLLVTLLIDILPMLGNGIQTFSFFPFIYIYVFHFSDDFLLLYIFRIWHCLCSIMGWDFKASMFLPSRTVSHRQPLPTTTIYATLLRKATSRIRVFTHFWRTSL